MLKPHTQPHGACTCRADERSLRERAPLQAPGQLCWCLFATSARAGEAKGGRGRVCEVRVPSGWTRPTKSAWRCGCSLPLTRWRGTWTTPVFWTGVEGRLVFHKKVCGKFRVGPRLYSLFRIVCDHVQFTWYTCSCGQIFNFFVATHRSKTPSSGGSTRTGRAPYTPCLSRPSPSPARARVANKHQHS